jgi:hypothetical protein
MSPDARRRIRVRGPTDFKAYTGELELVAAYGDRGRRGRFQGVGTSLSTVAAIAKSLKPSRPSTLPIVAG